ncbi:GNAT family N-acetyltransferase [Shewanella salipaludis]|uniref:GNAT family N-acetyltransferase n=1 Tax=Shewanella salipaludis TaxID=2723052 RepID=A0A972FXE1_9GAMM|nr:GNAT family N-acetyltransferase [Shewanella salipaludis]NMH63676.1 GNAT family N-acetyltransferase [Shewanella salipaludis]
MRITTVSQPADGDFEVLKNGLNGFNEVHTGSLYREKISSFVKDNQNQTLGGILGEIKWGWLYIEGLWVSESVRSKGFGSKLLQQLEDYAQSKGVTNYRLETTSFQALDFYKKQGYVLFGQLPDMPPTFTSYFLKKQTAI